MSFWLKLFGWILLFLGILYVILVVMLFVVLGVDATRESDIAGRLGALAMIAPVSLVVGILIASGILVSGAILYVGGRALDYMGQKTPEKHRPRRSARPVRPSASARHLARTRGGKPKSLTRIRFCKRCGKEIVWEDQHCRYCGARQ